MQTQKARGLTRVIPGSVATYPVDPNKTYKITAQKDKTGILFGMIAVPGDFPTNRTYYHALFPTGSSEQLEWPATINGTAFSRVHVYALLPWKKQSMPHQNVHQTTYDVGRNDGEPGDLARNQVATITVDLQKTGDGGKLFHDTTTTSLVLPAGIIEFAANHSVAVHPQVNAQHEHLVWAHISVDHEGSKTDFEEMARIHVISGTDGQDIVGYLDPAHTGPYSVRLGPLGQSNNNVNLIALITPTPAKDNPNGFDFSVGDPERNGKVTITQV